MNACKTMFALGALLTAAVLSGCGTDSGAPNADPSQFPDGSRMAEIATAGKLRVGTQTTYPLIGQQTFNGFEGFDVTIAEEFFNHPESGRAKEFLSKVLKH
jgi:glutamate transport system substrate-binding protein